MICEICKEEIKNFIALGLHLKRKQFTNEETPTNNFNKYSSNSDKVDFSGPQPLTDTIYRSGTFTIIR